MTVLDLEHGLGKHTAMGMGGEGGAGGVGKAGGRSGRDRLQWHQWNQHLQWWLETQRAGKVAVEHGQEDTVPCAGDEGSG